MAVLLLWIDCVFVSCVSHAFVSVCCCLVVSCWKTTVLLALIGSVYCIFVTFPCDIMGQVWYLIVSMPDLCRLSYFYGGRSVAVHSLLIVASTVVGGVCVYFLLLIEN